MTIVGVILVGLVACAAYGRRLARLGALQAARDVAAAIAALLRYCFYALRALARLIAGEVRSW